jgi:hypothetical protein
MRFILYLAAGLVFVAGWQLYVLSDQTETYFAWTIKPFLTAAFLGGGYWTSVLLEVLAVRQTTWAKARVTVYPVLAFTTLTLGATLLHIDRFHWSAPNPLTVAATWMWIAVYALVPLLLTAAIVLQLRVPGSDAMPPAPLPTWMRISLILQAFLMLGVGAEFFFAPFYFPDLKTAGAFLTANWVWTLTPLTGRAVAAWFIGLGLAAGFTARDNNYHLAQVALPAAALFGLLQLIALARFSADVAWAAPQTWLYVAFVVSMLVVGAYGTYAGRKI